MAIAIDVANLGVNHGDPSTTTITLTTTGAVASGGFIVVSVGWFNTVNLSSVSGGGLTWTIDTQGRPANPANSNTALVSAQAPSGLASGTTLTATFSGGAVARMIGATSFTGVATSSPAEATGGPTGAITTTAWTSASVALSAGSVLIATAYDETGNTTSTPTSPSVEALDWNYAGGVTQTTCYRIEASAGSYTVAGAYAATANSATNAVAYLAAAGGGGGSPTVKGLAALGVG